MNSYKPWLENYPTGVPANINADSHSSVMDALAESFTKFKDRPAFANMGKQLTYGEIDTLSTNFGAYLMSRGLEKGDRIALMMPNLLQYPIALYGALKAGLIVVNTNPLYTPREMKHQFTDAGVKAIVIASNYAANLEKIIHDTPIKAVILTDLGEMLGFPKKLVVNFMVKYIKGLIPKHTLKNTVSFQEALSQGKKFTLEPHVGKPNDTILIQYTGGTTGVSKGAMLTNRNLVANAEQVRAFSLSLFEEGKEVALCPLPLYHIFAFTIHGVCLAGIGALNVLITNPRDLPSVIKDMKTYPITMMTGVNTLFNALVNHPDFSTVDFTSLKVTNGGGMAVQRAVAEKWEKITGCFLTEGYGLTEASPVLSTNPVDGTARIGTIGMPLPSTEIRIVTDNGLICPLGQSGELQAKGPQIMKGYYNRPQETVDTIKDGWLCTGDIAVMEPDGFFKIVDRKKDMILVSGFNVFPNEIEEVLMMLPKVLEAAVIGVTDAKSGEAVKAFVVKKDASLTEQEVRDFCAENLTGYKKPRFIEFREELPKSNVGKILRRELRVES